MDCHSNMFFHHPHPLSPISLQTSSGLDKIPGDMTEAKRIAALEQRRCIVLAIIASTGPKNPSLLRILEKGLLTSLKSWLDDILNGKVGGVDLLLHLLSSISKLPVTKAIVRDSGMGRKVGSIEKHKICAGTPNQASIRARIQEVKSNWNSSVKTRKDPTSLGARKRLPGESTQGMAKRSKIDESSVPKKTFSSLLKKVSTLPGDARKVAKRGANVVLAVPPIVSDAKSDEKASKAKKTNNKRVKWADHFGGILERTREIEGKDGEQPMNNDGDAPGTGSWADRKKRDRLREKELLARAKKSKLSDDDDDDIFSTTLMRPTTSWHQPRSLPDRHDVTKPQRDSKELIAQIARTARATKATYMSENSVPSNPTPMSDVEQALDINSQASAIVAKIPFFIPQEPSVPVPAPIPAVPTQHVVTAVPQNQLTYGHGGHIPPPPPPPQSATMGATVETVSAMGLPMFLVGSNVQALQTLASNPSLLSTFVDANGMYDQQRLLNLVQTLTQSIPGQAQPPAPPTNPYGTMGGYQPAVQPAQAYGTTPSSAYGPAATATSPYGYIPTPTPTPTPTGPYGGGGATTGNGAANNGGGYRGDQNAEGNLHLSGYGPLTTKADIIALFSPYVRVNEVVMKATFSFVNTADPEGAKRAREALTGALLGGTPVRINMAQRRARDANYGNNTSMASIYGGAREEPAFKNPPAVPAAPAGFSAPPPPAPSGGAADVSSVRDDRGNPATKNLFVAGYGPGTTEQQVREVFSQQALITGCVMKGNFTFVNTTDKQSAVTAREGLTGVLVNGGMLRINFAKETGRLGTSFDLTYGPNTSTGNRSYYGR
mmetsp:Transcript_3862/g.5705  ORF Transcript_3862/g.5705 Transcript_3862/m.5705 type:complete len:830 (+) Transcript_3862:2315-4804(+)